MNLKNITNIKKIYIIIKQKFLQNEGNKNLNYNFFYWIREYL